MPRGGVRPGAGMPKGKKCLKTLEREAFRARYIARIAPEWDKIIEAELDLAKGFALIDKKDDTGERIYDRPPSVDAIKNIKAEIMGKPMDSVKLSGEGENGEILVSSPESLAKYAVLRKKYEAELKQEILK